VHDGLVGESWRHRRADRRLRRRRADHWRSDSATIHPTGLCDV